MPHFALMMGSGQQQHGTFSPWKSEEDTVCSILFDLWELSLHQPGLLKEKIPQLSQQPDQHQGPGLTLRPSDLKCGSF